MKCSKTYCRNATDGRFARCVECRARGRKASSRHRKRRGAPVPRAARPTASLEAKLRTVQKALRVERAARVRLARDIADMRHTHGLG